MKDAGHPIEWGPGRHGPGANAFNYFIDPFGVVTNTPRIASRSTTRTGSRPRRLEVDHGAFRHWGISAPPSDRLKEAQKQIFFAAR